MKFHSRRAFLALGGSALVSTVSACGGLPRGAPQRNEVLAGAENGHEEFSIQEVTRAGLARLRAWPAATGVQPRNWPRGGAGGAAVIAPGDRLDLRIWDSESASLITAPEQPAAEMAGVRVSPTGRIFLPYIGEVPVAGLTPDAARREIQNQMEAIVPSAQVQLAALPGRRNSVDLISGVARPGSYPLEDDPPSVLGLIALGGGVPGGMRNPQVRLIRAGQVYLTSLAQIYESPARDITLQGGDQLAVEEDTRFFIALGAVGHEEVMPFTTDRISALRAVSMMGGMNAARADPRGILVLRRYPARAIRHPGGPASERVVFSLDLTSADGLFSADEFLLQSGDVVLATEAPVTSTQLVLRMLGDTLVIANRASGL